MATVTFQAPILGRSEYGTRQPEVRLTTDQHWRRLQAEAHRLAADLEDRSECYGWIVNVGSASCAGGNRSTLRVWLELSEDSDFEAKMAMQVLQLAVAHAARSLRISIETAPAPTTKRLAGRSR